MSDSLSLATIETIAQLAPKILAVKADIKRAASIRKTAERETALDLAFETLDLYTAKQAGAIVQLLTTINGMRDALAEAYYSEELSSLEFRDKLDREKTRMYRTLVNALMIKTGCARDAAEIVANALTEMNGAGEYAQDVDAFLRDAVAELAG